MNIRHKMNRLFRKSQDNEELDAQINFLKRRSEFQVAYIIASIGAGVTVLFILAIIHSPILNWSSIWNEFTKINDTLKLTVITACTTLYVWYVKEKKKELSDLRAQKTETRLADEFNREASMQKISNLNSRLSTDLAKFYDGKTEVAGAYLLLNLIDEWNNMYEFYSKYDTPELTLYSSNVRRISNLLANTASSNLRLNIDYRIMLTEFVKHYLFAYKSPSNLNGPDTPILSMEFSKLDLSYLIIQKESIAKVSFRHVNIHHSQFDEVTLDDVNLENVNLARSTFTNSKLMNLNEMQLHNTNFSSVKLTDTILKNLVFKRKKLINTTINKTIVDNTNFNDVGMDNIQFHKGTIQNSAFNYVSLRIIRTTYSRLKNLTATHVNFGNVVSPTNYDYIDENGYEMVVYGATQYSYFTNVEFNKSNIHFWSMTSNAYSNVDVNSTYIKSTDWTKSVFSQVEFNDSSLNEVTFENCVFANVTFKEGFLDNVSFTGCAFINVIFSGVHLYQTSFDGVDLNTFVNSSYSTIDRISDSFIDPSTNPFA